MRAISESIKSFGGFIVGGTPTDVAHHPWQAALNVSLANGDSVLCGGAIIDKRWVLTAAHCFGRDGGHARAQVKTGVTNFKTEGAWVNVVRIVPHPRYNDDAAGYAVKDDIALVMIETDAKGAPIARQNGNLPFRSGQLLEVTGWGTLSDGSLEPSMILRQTQVRYVDNATCQQSYPGETITGGMACAGLQDGGRGPCQGDSGGPLVFKTGEAVGTLIGIVSAGKGCALPRFYGIYTRVSEYNDWIAQTTNPSH